MFKVIRDLLRYDVRFRIAIIFLTAMMAMIILSFFSPYNPNKSFVVAMDQSPSLQHIFGTDSRGMDIFWWMTFALRNSFFLGVIAASVSRVIAILVGLAAGYQGGWLDRFLMSVNDTFVVIPLLPILILLGFLLRDIMNQFLLGFLLGLFGWPYDARLIRSQVLSLRERSFTRTAFYSGATSFWITIREHLPFVMPIVLATTINNILWAIGFEVTLSILGLSDLTHPSIGTALYWANQHGALVAGVWWWIMAPTLVATILCLGLYLLFTSINDYIDPRTRLRLLGG
jgi:peptide/nickel transport system permease protein